MVTNYSNLFILSELYANTAMSDVNVPVVYRKYDDGFLVRSMTPADVEIVLKFWSDNYVTTRGLGTVLGLHAPGSHGFYVGEFDGRIVASQMVYPWSDDVSYASFWYVKPEFRKRGFGARIKDDVAMAHALASGRVICLDVVSEKLAADHRVRRGYVDAPFRTTRICIKAKLDYETVEFAGQLLTVSHGCDVAI